MTRAFFILFLIDSCFALTFYNCPTPNAYGDSSSLSGAMSLWRNQWFNVDMSVMFKNYSVVGNPGSLCDPSSIPAPKQPSVIVSDSVSSVSCRFAGQQKGAQRAGYFGAMVPNWSADYFMLYWWNDGPIPFGIPLFGGDTELSRPQLVQNSLTGVVSGFVDDGFNITVFLASPMDPNLNYVDCESGGCFYINYIGFAFALFLVVFGAGKWATFFVVEGIKLSVPQICLTFAILVGFVLICHSFWAVYGLISVSTHEIVSFSYNWNFCFSFCALGAMAMYFAEISALTSARGGVGGFSRFKWPLIAFLSLLFLTQLTQSLIRTFPPSTVNSQNGAFVQFSLSVYSLISAIMVVLTIWGGVSLILSVNPGQKSFISVVLVSVVTFLATVLVVVSCLIFLCLSDYVGGWGGPLGEQVTYYGWAWITMGLNFFGPACAMISLCFLFKVSTHKEIELSKSGTSSTSSGSRSSSSSSSSSSAADPVIEL